MSKTLLLATVLTIYLAASANGARPYLHKAFAFAPISIGDATEITAPAPSDYAAKLDRAALGSLRSQLAQFSYALHVANPPASEKYEEAVAALPAPAKLG